VGSNLLYFKGKGVSQQKRKSKKALMQMDAGKGSENNQGTLPFLKPGDLEHSCSLDPPLTTA
jgi:hypothetical protein